MRNGLYQRVLVLLALMSLTSLNAALATPFQDVLVQAPSIGSPQRGSLAGTLSKLAFGPGDLARGAFALPLPIEAPSDRGPLLAKVLPSYSPETGITEWGMGWQAELTIQRFQPRGEVNFVNDELTSPWGHLVRAGDGSYYPLGLATVIRVTDVNGGWVAQSGDGTRYRFDAADSVQTGQGTFAWMLSRVDTIFGDSTTLTWTRNTSGRPFLAAVHWGGRNDGTQYQMRFTYAPVAFAFVSYISSEKQLLDQRITQVAIEVKQGTSYALRWRYDLAYVAGPTGSAYYLRQLTRTYASGATDPPMIYDYDLNTELWADTQLVHAPGLDEFIAANGSNAIQPDHATLMDLEQDGLLDLETSFDQTTVRQTPSGYFIEPLPPAPSQTDPACRPNPSAFNKPRRLARMHGDAVEPQVVALEKIGFGGSTRVLVCDRLGVPLFDENVLDNWELGANTRLADVDLDKRPDIVRVRTGEVALLRNTSSGPQALSFAPGPITELSPQVTPIASWVLDLNGDGRADLMVKHSNGVFAWFGTGNGEFDSVGQSFDFVTASGTPLPALAGYQFSHGDFNGDGMSDVLLTQGQTVLVFINTGAEFVQTIIPGLLDIPWTVTFPVIADLAGTGNESAIFVNGDQVLALQLTSPSTGLLRSANDGKGTVVHFRYGRAFGHPGIVHRYATLTELTIESSGYDTVSYSYDYGSPVLHTLGKYLVGFTSVDKRAPVLTEHMTFRNTDDFAGVRDLAEDIDERTPGIIRFTQRRYDESRFRGVRWLRPSSVETGYRSPDGLLALSTTTQYTTYQRELCPTVTMTTGPNGQLVTTTTLANVAAIPSDLSCIVASQQLAGIHPDSSLDFSYLVNLERNDFGQLTHVAQFGPTVDLLVFQDITYDGKHRVASIASPGHGTLVSSYDALGRLGALTDSVGLTTRVGAFDPVSDALLDLRTDRPAAVSAVFFAYDGRERLQASWDDVSGASQAQPGVSYAYQDATAISPGRIDTRILADAAAGVSRRTVDLVAADGEPLLAGTWLGDHFSLGRSSIRSRNTLVTRSSFIGAMTDTSLAAMTSADLRALGAPLAESTYAGFGHAIQTTTTQQASVVGTTTTELALGDAELVTRVRQPGGFVAESAIDAAGKLVRKIDENGVVHRYKYDALGRLVHIETPDGGHTLTFDGFGRPERVTRDSIGAVAYTYDPVTGLLIRKQWFDTSGRAIETSNTHYDATGRPLQISQTSNGGASELRFDYDGELDGATAIGQLGRLTRVRGDGWERSQLFDPLGRAYEQYVALTGWRNLTIEKMFRADGSVASDTLTIADTDGVVKFASTKDTTLDSAGRVSALKIDGSVLYTLSYDIEGRLARADFTSGETLVFDYDAATHLRRGYRIEAPSVSGGVRWDRDQRGLVAAETYSRSGTATRRDYTYDGRGALTRSAAAGDVASYTYTESGLPESIDDVEGTRSVHRTSQTLVAGDVTYTWDAAGRVIGKNEWRLDYGPSGQLTRASRPGRQIEFVYDDSNSRLLKRIDGVPVRADVANGVLTEDHFIELVTIGGVVAGVLDNGQFTTLLTDPRGTPFAGSDGTSSFASPYGVRASHLDFAEVIDYARLGWDPDLDVVRMGVRDYDPKLSQFLTPDPLYMEDLEKCQGSSLQCSLYGYAGGNPVSFVDPTGTQAWSAGGEGPSPMDSLFGLVAESFVTNMEDPHTWAVAGGVVLAAGTAGAALTALPAVCVLGESAEALEAGLALEGLFSTTTAGATTVAVAAESTTATVSIGTALQASTILMPTASVNVVSLSTVLPVVGETVAVGGAAGAANALTDSSIGATGGPLGAATEAEIDAALSTAGSSGPMITAPAPTGARYNVSGGMMVNEHTVPSTSSAAGASGNVATRIRVHTADPTAPPGSNSATGNSVTITQGGGARRLIPWQGWVQTSTATATQMNASHIPIHR